MLRNDDHFFLTVVGRGIGLADTSFKHTHLFFLCDFRNSVSLQREYVLCDTLTVQNPEVFMEQKKTCVGPRSGQFDFFSERNSEPESTVCNNRSRQALLLVISYLHVSSLNDNTTYPYPCVLYVLFSQQIYQGGRGFRGHIWWNFLVMTWFFKLERYVTSAFCMFWLFFTSTFIYLLLGCVFVI